MINLTVVIDNEEAVRKFRELQQTAKTVTTNVVNDADRMDIAMHKLGNTLAQIGVGVSLAGFVRQLAMTRGEFQQLEVAFTTLLQSKEKADALMAEMVELAAKTPFDLRGVADGARQLLAYGFAAEDITDTLTRLGNVAAGLGLPLERLTYLYGTTAVQGRLYTRDMLQFTSSGIPVLQEMADMYGKTTEEINAMVEAGEIGFEDVKKVIEGMTNEGGQFYNLMQEQSKTISGLISNLGDAIDSMFNNMGKSSEGVIAGVLQGTISLVENYQKVLDVLIPLIAAYGTYKAALIATAAIQKVQTTVAATKAILEQTKMLTRATQAQILFNKAVKANPYVLAASALIGVVTALTAFSKKAKDTEEIVSDLNAATSEYASNADDLLSLADTYDTLSEKTARTEAENAKLKDTIGKLASAVPSAISQFDEYGRALDVNIEKIRQFSDAQKEALRIDVTAQIDTAKSRVSEIDKELSSLKTIYQDKYYYRNKTTTVGGQLVELQDLEKVPYSEKQIEDAARKANELYAERLKLIEAIEKGENTLAGITTGEQQSNTTAGPIVSATENFKSAQKAYTEAVKAWKAAVSGGEDVSIVKEKQGAVDTAKKALDEAKKLVGVDDKTTNTVTKAQEKLSDLILANDKALQQSRIGILKEGKQKELAEIDLRTKEELNKLEQDKLKLEAAQGGSMTENQTKDFQEREANIKKKDADDRAAAELKYAQELDRIYKQITEDTLSEEDRRIKGIKEKYEEFRKWVDNALKAGNISQDQATDLGIKIDRAEIAASLNAVVEEFNSAEDKIAKIRQKAENARKAATAGGREDLIPQINKSEAQQVGEIRAEELMKTDDWINLFQNLDALSSREILRIIDNINSLLKDADLDPINLKTVTDKLDEAAETATRKNPFASISANFKAYKRALADGDDLRAAELRKQAWLGVSEALNIVSSKISGISSIASTFGAGDDAAASINEIAGVVGGTAQAVAGFASGKFVQGIQGVVSVISNLGSLLSGDRRKERTIEALQDQVDALKKSYDNLGDAIDKAYSINAANLIEQNNQNLEQQKILIQKQIEEEKSKKKPDDDRIKAWEDQLDAIDGQISDNIDRWQEYINGISFDTFRSDFLDTLMDMSASAEDFADDFEQYLQRSILDALLANKYDEKIRALYDKMAQYGEDGLTQQEIDELRKQREQIVNDALADRDKLAQIYGWDSQSSESSQSGTSRGFSTMSQDTASELNGRFTDIQGKINILVEQAQFGRSISIEQLNRMTDTRDILVQMNGNVADIRTFTKVLPEMRDSLAAMNRKLDNL